MAGGFLKWAQRFETLDLHDFVGFSEARETIFTGHLRLLKQSHRSSQKSRSGFGKHLIEFTDFIYVLYDNRYSLSSPNLGPSLLRGVTILYCLTYATLEVMMCWWSTTQNHDSLRSKYLRKVNPGCRIDHSLISGRFVWTWKQNKIKIPDNQLEKINAFMLIRNKIETRIASVCF